MGGATDGQVAEGRLEAFPTTSHWWLWVADETSGAAKACHPERSDLRGREVEGSPDSQERIFASNAPLNRWGFLDLLADSFAQNDIRVGVVIPQVDAAPRRGGAQDDMSDIARSG